jgi:hypothetical protein
MSVDECAWCSAEITGESVRFKNLVFCSAECCEEYQEDLASDDEPDPGDLEGELSDEDLEDYDFDDDDDDDGELDDDLLDDDSLAYEDY